MAHSEMSLNMLCLQVTHAAQNPARIGEFVPPLGIKIVMNVTAHKLGILGQIAQHVSMDGAQVKPLCHLVFHRYSFPRLPLHSRVPHLGQSVPEAIAQHCPLPSHPLQGFLEHHQQHLLPQGRHHEIRPDL